jgi:hypothetical protein
MTEWMIIELAGKAAGMTEGPLIRLHFLVEANRELSKFSSQICA